MPLLKPLLVSLLLCAATLAQAAAQDARWYRYYDERRQPNVTDKITPEHVIYGYDELNTNMQVIRHVPAQRPLTAEELAAAKARKEAIAQRKHDDQQLLRLYTVPADAEHARNRLIDAIQVRIDFNNSSLAGLRQRRATEAQKAAVFERTGKPVPNDLRESIASYDRQIQATQAEINQRKGEQDKVREDFVPVIERLHELTGKPSPPSTPAQP